MSFLTYVFVYFNINFTVSFHSETNLMLSMSTSCNNLKPDCGIASPPTLSSRQNLYTFSMIARHNVVAEPPFKIGTKMLRSFKGKENIHKKERR